MEYAMSIDEQVGILTTDLMYWEGKLSAAEQVKENRSISEIKGFIAHIKNELFRLGDLLDIEV
jgi:hypothetical protein